ncbi:protein translocase subunit SecD [Pikeienuella piscinae]|uniref:Protein translocase subunit SecD n=1 Tax=Pikeienuella piscinae TaxID=2748098 RepID=A0A7L5BSZ1_9RHOB|nr:protein translocase subunit SecD [Pikeienuella piscinae]QIE54545.1 protein translocase subunit SecD [Pikeienuella piscinae]
MLYFSLWKKALVIGLCLIGVILAAPNLAYERADDAALARKQIAKLEKAGAPVSPELEARAAKWPSFLPSNVVNLGLDLRGGAHLLVEVRIEDVISERMEAVRDDARAALRDAGVRRYSRLAATEDRVSVRITDADDLPAARAALSELAQSVADAALGVSAPDLEISDGPDQSLVVTMTPSAIAALTDRTMAQSLEIIRRRVDEAGTREPSIQRQGERRILVQVPGVSSTLEIKELIGKTAKLTFHLVDGRTSDLKRAAGPGKAVYEDAEEPGAGYIVERRALVTGDELQDAQPGFDSQTGEPVVNFRFDTSGARKFGRATSENVGRPFAVVLDDKVITAPVIREPILGGSGQISGSFTVEGAQQLAILLRAGALPASISFEEERTVGPGLGADSIAAGKTATIVAFVAVLVFMMLSYGLFGVFANIALIVNVGLIIGVLSLIGATLTLPGIAGIVLTIGMAVDANVLIFERIREELRGAKNVARSIELGYERAFSAIVDANITTLIAAAILFGMGSGPVRGFAVTLGIGIITSVFTAVMVTRLIVASWYDRRRPKTLTV